MISLLQFGESIIQAIALSTKNFKRMRLATELTLFNMIYFDLKGLVTFLRCICTVHIDPYSHISAHTNSEKESRRKRERENCHYLLHVCSIC